MQTLSLLPVDEDIIDRILTSLSSFADLRSTVLTAKRIYFVYKARPNSILQAVVHNVTGPAYPQAMRVLRYSPNYPDSWTWRDLSPVKHVEIRVLKKNVAVVKGLEDLFSSRHKDRSSQVSKLNTMESWRFSRAVYTLMLFSYVFPEHELDGMDDPTSEEIEDSVLQRKLFFLDIPTEELREIHSVAEFLTEIVMWSKIAENHMQQWEDYDSRPLAIGPAQILKAYQTMSVSNTFDVGSRLSTLPRDHISDPLAALWDDREVDPPPDNSYHWRSVLDEIHGEKDRCHRCSSVQGFDLWNETNCEYLWGVHLTAHTAPFWHYLVPRGIFGEHVDAGFDRELRRSDTFTYTQLLQEIHGIRTRAYETWELGDWMCAPCIVRLIATHLHLWLLDHKKKAGYAILPDCVDGYGCKLQFVDNEHARAFNHLSEPRLSQRRLSSLYLM